MNSIKSFIFSNGNETEVRIVSVMFENEHFGLFQYLSRNKGGQNGHTSWKWRAEAFENMLHL